METAIACSTVGSQESRGDTDVVAEYFDISGCAMGFPLVFFAALNVRWSCHGGICTLSPS
jgi:hypothetical protein